MTENPGDRRRQPEVFIAQDDMIRRVLDRAGYDVTTEQGRKDFLAFLTFCQSWQRERELLGLDISFLQKQRRDAEARAATRAPGSGPPGADSRSGYHAQGGHCDPQLHGRAGLSRSGDAHAV